MDFFDNHDVLIAGPGYFVIDGALKHKDGQIFGDIQQKNILMSISLKSEEIFQKLVSDNILNSEFFIIYEDIEPNEFSEDPYVILKKGKFFESDYELFKRLKEISFKFKDGSIPLTLVLLQYWYVPIHSNNTYKNVLPLYENKDLIFDMDYIIIDEEITCKDGSRVLGKKTQITICFEFISKYYRRPFQLLFNKGILQEEQVFRAIDFNKKHLEINYLNWHFKNNKQRFRNVKKMSNYLKEIDFKFEDNSYFVL